MPNRMIREDMLESERVLSLPVEARWLYVTILLSADDVGLFEATPFKLARIADVRREHADRLVAMLVDVDLVRLYEVGGKRFGFIPRYGQRLQIKRIKHAAPPDALLSDEPETLKKIKDLASNPTVDHGCASAGQRKSTAAQPPEPEPEPEVEPKKKEELPSVVGARGRSAPKPKASKRCPVDFEPSSELIAWVLMDCQGVNWQRETASFKDWEFKTARSDWPATWRGWMRKAFDSLQQRRAAQPETFRERDARLAAEEVARWTGGLAHNRAALKQPTEPLPFERGYRKPEPDVIEGSSNVRIR